MDHRPQRAPPPFHSSSSSDRSEANAGSTCISPLQKSGAGRRTSPRLPSATAFAVRPKRTCRDGGLRLCRPRHPQSNVYLITQFLPSDRRCRTLLDYYRPIGRLAGWSLFRSSLMIADPPSSPSVIPFVLRQRMLALSCLQGGRLVEDSLGKFAILQREGKRENVYSLRNSSSEYNAIEGLARGKLRSRWGFRGVKQIRGQICERFSKERRDPALVRLIRSADYIFLN